MIRLALSNEHSTCPILPVAPSCFAHQWHKPDTTKIVVLETVLVDAPDAKQCLAVERRTNRNHKPAANAELMLQRRRHFGRGGGNNNAIVGRVLGPTERAIAMSDVDIVVTQRLQSLTRAIG